MSYTIKKLSSNGFLLSDLGWKTVDKFKVLVKPLFLDLKVGDKIDSLKFNKEGYITDFIVLTREDKEVEGTSQIASLNNSQHSSVSRSLPSSSTKGDVGLERGGLLGPRLSKWDSFYSPSVQDNIRYGQAVNIAFASFNGVDGNLDLNFKGNIQKGFDLADEIFKEFNKRVGGN